MKKISLLLLTIFASLISRAQLIGPTPAPPCSGSSSNFSSSSIGNTFIYTFENNPSMDFSLSSIPSSSIVYSGDSLSASGYTNMIGDKGHWYSFTSNHDNNQIIRLDYGASPLNAPTATSLGNFGSGSRIEGISIMKNNDSTWVGFTVNDNKLIRWEFQNNDLNGMPINISTMDFTGFLNYGLQISIKKIDSTIGYIGFVGNRDGTIVRFDFGGSLLNIPMVNNLPSTYLSACNFVLYEQNNQWYMVTSNLSLNSLSRIEFGTNIKNNNPTVINLGNINNLLSFPRGMCLFPNCDPDQLIGYLLNEDGSLIKLDFGGDITNVPSGTNLGTLSGTSGFSDMGVFTFENKIYTLTTNFISNSILRMPLFTIPNPYSVQYHNSSATYNYASGTYTASLYVDPGSSMDPQAFCKTFVVDSCGSTGLSNLTLDKENSLYQNYPNPFSKLTLINYKISKRAKIAKICIYDLTGKELLKFPVFAQDKAGLELTNKELIPGIYFYSLLIDGHKVDTKKLIIE